MRLDSVRGFALLGAIFWIGVATPAHAKKAIRPSSEAERLEYLRSARVSVDTGRGDRTLIQGPELDPSETFAWGEEVRCRFIEPDPSRPPGGKTPKLDCERIFEGKPRKLRVKYQTPLEHNDGVWGEILSTRLFWALGFPADTVTPVTVVCENCPQRPWQYARAVINRARAKPDSSGKLGRCDYRTPPAPLTAEQRLALPRAERHCHDERTALFEPRVTLRIEDAIVETRFKARPIESFEDQGWSWDEWDGIAPTPERDALALLAAFVQHADNKPQQQRLVCLTESAGGETGRKCLESAVLIHDLGFTFGQGYIDSPDHASDQQRRDARSLQTASREGFAAAPVWSDPRGCVTHLAYYRKTGTPAQKRISEPGRAFLADRLSGMTDQDLRDLFTVARIERRGDSVASWVEAFKAKARQITEHRCPAAR